LQSAVIQDRSVRALIIRSSLQVTCTQYEVSKLISKPRRACVWGHFLQ